MNFIPFSIFARLCKNPEGVTGEEEHGTPPVGVLSGRGWKVIVGVKAGPVVW